MPVEASEPSSELTEGEVSPRTPRTPKTVMGRMAARMARSSGKKAKSAGEDRADRLAAAADESPQRPRTPSPPIQRRSPLLESHARARGSSFARPGERPFSLKDVGTALRDAGCELAEDEPEEEEPFSFADAVVALFAPLQDSPFCGASPRSQRIMEEEQARHEPGDMLAREEVVKAFAL